MSKSDFVFVGQIKTESGDAGPVFYLAHEHGARDGRANRKVLRMDGRSVRISIDFLDKQPGESTLFLDKLPHPVRRNLLSVGVLNDEQLKSLDLQELASIKGVGPGRLLEVASLLGREKEAGDVLKETLHPNAWKSAFSRYKDVYPEAFSERKETVRADYISKAVGASEGQAWHMVDPRSEKRSFCGVALDGETTSPMRRADHKTLCKTCVRILRQMDD